MTDQAENWFKEKIKNKIRARFQSHGGYLDGTMVTGDGHAGVIKFPRVGRVDAYEIFGAIQKIKDVSPDLDMIPVSLREFEASAWLRTQDANKQGPSEQQAVADVMQKAIRRTKDDVRYEAVNVFAAGSTEINTIGDGTAVIDILDVLQAKSQIMASGAEDEMFFPCPHSCFDQLLMYKEIANSDYVGPDLPFANSSKVMKKTWQGVHIFGVPDELFKYGTAGWNKDTGRFAETGYLDLPMWSRDAVGAEVEWLEDKLSITNQPLMEGSPNLGKVGMTAAAVGILPEGVKRLRVKVQTRPVRPT